MPKAKKKAKAKPKKKSIKRKAQDYVDKKVFRAKAKIEDTISLKKVKVKDEDGKMVTGVKLRLPRLSRAEAKLAKSKIGKSATKALDKVTKPVNRALTKAVRASDRLEEKMGGTSTSKKLMEIKAREKAKKAGKSKSKRRKK